MAESGENMLAGDESVHVCTDFVQKTPLLLMCLAAASSSCQFASLLAETKRPPVAVASEG